MKITVNGNSLGFFDQVHEKKWTPAEDEKIMEVTKVSTNPWIELASILNRSPSACSTRYDDLVTPPSDRRHGTVRKRIFTAVTDSLLTTSSTVTTSSTETAAAADCSE